MRARRNHRCIPRYILFVDFFSTLGFQTPCFWRYLDPKDRTSAGIWKTRGIDRSLNVSSQIILLWVLPFLTTKTSNTPNTKTSLKNLHVGPPGTWKYLTAPNPSLLGRAALLGCILGIPEKSAALLVAAGGRRAPEIPQPVIGTRRGERTYGSETSRWSEKNQWNPSNL